MFTGQLDRPESDPPSLASMQVGVDSPGPSYTIPAALGKQQVGGQLGWLLGLAGSFCGLSDDCMQYSAWHSVCPAGSAYLASSPCAALAPRPPPPFRHPATCSCQPRRARARL